MLGYKFDVTKANFSKLLSEAIVLVRLEEFKKYLFNDGRVEFLRNMASSDVITNERRSWIAGIECINGATMIISKDLYNRDMRHDFLKKYLEHRGFNLSNVSCNDFDRLHRIIGKAEEEKNKINQCALFCQVNTFKDLERDVKALIKEVKDGLKHVGAANTIKSNSCLKKNTSITNEHQSFNESDEAVIRGAMIVPPKTVYRGMVVSQFDLDWEIENNYNK